jgi:hypothetical protein
MAKDTNDILKGVGIGVGALAGAAGIIYGICRLLSETIESARVPATILPPTLTYAGGVCKPGLSPMLIASKIISRQAEAGAPYGPMADGSANVAEAMEAIRVEEIINAIHNDGQIQISIPPGGIMVTAMGGNAGGPVTVTGVSTNFVSGVGNML